MAHHFLAHFNQSKRKQVTGFHRDVMSVMEKYTWPGNVRELENLIERLVILKVEGEIESRDLPDKYFSTVGSRRSSHILPPDGIHLDDILSAIENDLIDQALLRTGGNRNRAAKLLSLKRTTLVEKLKRRK